MWILHLHKFTQKNFKVHSKAYLLTRSFSDLNKYWSLKHQRKHTFFTFALCSLLAYVVPFIELLPEKVTWNRFHIRFRLVWTNLYSQVVFVRWPLEKVTSTWNRFAFAFTLCEQAFTHTECLSNGYLRTSGIILTDERTSLASGRSSSHQVHVRVGGAGTVLYEHRWNPSVYTLVLYSYWVLHVLCFILNHLE